MRFEKWQALGNDYLVVEAEPLHRRRRCGGCATRTSGPAPTACSRSAPPTQPGFVARLRIFNPDGSRGRAERQRRPHAILYLRRRAGPTQRHVLDRDGRRRDPADDHRTDAPAGSTWAAPQLIEDRASVRRRLPLPGADDRQPAVRDPRRRPRRARRARPARRSARRSSTTRASPTAPTSPSGPSSRPTASARASSSAGWGRRCRSGHRGVRRRHRPRRPRRRLAGHRRARRRRARRSTSTEDLHVDLTGWAEPVYAGELSPELLDYGRGMSRVRRRRPRHLRAATASSTPGSRGPRSSRRAPSRSPSADPRRRDRRSRSTSTRRPQDVPDAYLRLHLLSHDRRPAARGQPRRPVRRPAQQRVDEPRARSTPPTWRRSGSRSPRPAAGPRRRQVPAPDRLRDAGGRAHRRRQPRAPRRPPRPGHDGDARGLRQLQRRARSARRWSRAASAPASSSATARDIGGGASIMGTLSGGNKDVISVGEGCLVGANAGLGISPRATAASSRPASTSPPARSSRCPTARPSRARELSGAPDLLFRRHSVTGAPRGGPAHGRLGRPQRRPPRRQ